jgi:transcriptional/translational regulatory protein YebC/TACO1
MDYKLKEIILKYFTAQCNEEIQTILSKHEDDEERVREELSEELSRLLYDDVRVLPEHVANLPDVRDYLEALLQYIDDNADVDDLVTYIDWE